jgi:hypothetical protein
VKKHATNALYLQVIESFQAKTKAKEASTNGTTQTNGSTPASKQSQQKKP